MQNEQSTELQVNAPQPTQGAMSQPGAFSGNMQSFQDAQRIAGALSQSTLVPSDYKNNVANCMIALEMAQRCNANPMAVMQNLHIIHGRPSWSSQFTIAALNGCGRFSPLRFEVIGGPQDEDKWGCRAWAIDLSNDERLDGPWVSIKMAKAEGWYGKKGSKWQTMPDLMLRYRAAKFFGNLYAPDLLMGMSTDDESHDIRNSQQAAQREVPEMKRGFNPAQTVEQEPPQEKVIESEPVSDHDITDNF